MNVKKFLNNRHWTNNVLPVRSWRRVPLRDSFESYGVRPAGSRKGRDNQRAFCSLSGECSPTQQAPARCLAYGCRRECRLSAIALTTQRTGGQPFCHLALEANRIRRTNGRGAIRKEPPASQQRVSPWNFQRFRHGGVTGNPVASGTWTARLRHVIPPRARGAVSYPIDYRLRGSTGTNSRDWQLQISNVFGDESVAGIREQSGSERSTPVWT